MVAGGLASGARAARAPGEAGPGRLYYSLHTLAAPAEIHACDADGRNPAALTRFTAPALAGLALGEVREVTFEGARGEKVQMFVILPPDYRGSRERLSRKFQLSDCL